MAREYTFKAILNFNFSSHSEMSATRTTVLAFASNNGGTADIMTLEDSDNETMPYYGRIALDIPVASRSEASTLMGTIDAALSGLPDLVEVNGSKLFYSFKEKEI